MLMCLESHHQLLYYLKKGQNKEAKSILQNLEDFCRLTDTSGWTLLHYSVKYSNGEMTRYLIEQGCDVNARDNVGVVPLMLAVEEKNPWEMEILLENDADIYVTNSDGQNSLQVAFYSIFHQIVREESYSLLEILFDKLNQDFLEGSLTQFLLNANDEMKFVLVAFSKAEVTRFILENGYPIDFHLNTARGYTALHVAVMCDSLENAKILIERGANVDALDNDNCSPLRCYTGNLEKVDKNSEVLKMLLRSSSSLSRPDMVGYTDVDSLLRFGNESTVRTVLMSDIDVDACIIEDESLLSVLIHNYRIDNFDILAELDNNFDVNERGAYDRTALMSVILYRLPKKVEFLLQHGADVNLTTEDGSSALYYAMTLDTRDNVGVEIIELLLEYGADADAQYFLSFRSYFMIDISIHTKIVGAHLAMLGKSLSDSSRSIIESIPPLRNYFDFCIQQLEGMKQVYVHGTVTLFNLLTERKEKIVAYARNQELLSEWSRSMENLSQFESYYVNTLQKRLAEGRETAKLQEKAALAIEELTGLSTDVYHAIVYKIISYLNHRDLCNLGQIESIIQ